MRYERGDYDKYFKGAGIDIGSGNDPLRIVEGTVIPWEYWTHGDAQYLKTIPTASLDFAYSSHCLEHMVSIEETLKSWARVLKSEGYLYIVVPDYALYEHLGWPSKGNPDHKYSFSLDLTREQVGRTNHYHLKDVESILLVNQISLLSWALEDAKYDYTLGPEVDQTLGEALAQICLIGQKGRVQHAVR